MERDFNIPQGHYRIGRDIPEGVYLIGALNNFSIIAAITGSIAEAFYGLPAETKNSIMPYLDEPLKNALESFESLVQKSC